MAAKRSTQTAEQKAFRSTELLPWGKTSEPQLLGRPPRSELLQSSHSGSEPCAHPAALATLWPQLHPAVLVSASICPLLGYRDSEGRLQRKECTSQGYLLAVCRHRQFLPRLRTPTGIQEPALAVVQLLPKAQETLQQGNHAAMITPEGYQEFPRFTLLNLTEPSDS